jgi:hypothetical protein
MKPVYLLGLTVFAVVCVAAVIEYTVRAMFDRAFPLDGIYGSSNDDW